MRKDFFVPIKILYVHGITEIGGAETDLLAILQDLHRDHFSPSVACPPTGALVERMRDIGIPVIPFSFPAWRKLKDLWRLPFAVRSLAAVLHKEKFDLVHSNDYWWTPMVWLASRISGIPCLVHVRQEIEPRRVKQYWLTKPARLLAICRDIRQAAIHGGVDPHRVQVVYSGLNLSSIGHLPSGRIRARYGLSPGQPVIGAVANLFPRKGYESLLKALAEIRVVIPDIHCIIVGEGDEAYGQSLIALAKELELTAAVTFAGFQREVLAHMADCDVMVLPSLLEGFGMVLLEAMAMAKPVVASRVGGIPEAVEDGVTGVLVPPGNSGELAGALLRLLKDPALRDTMGKAGRKRVETMFSLERTIEELESTYRQLVSQRHPEHLRSGNASVRNS